MYICCPQTFAKWITGERLSVHPSWSSLVTPGVGTLCFVRIVVAKTAAVKTWRVELPPPTVHLGH